MPEPNNKRAPTPLSSYQKTEVLTANKETILLMMYSGAIRFLKQAIQATEEKKEPERIKYISKTQEIINELRATLNHDIGPEIAKNLEILYEYVSQALAKGNIKRSSQDLKDALKVLSTLNSAWEEAVASLKKQKNSK